MRLTQNDCYLREIGLSASEIATRTDADSDIDTIHNVQ